MKSGLMMIMNARLKVDIENISSAVLLCLTPFIMTVIRKQIPYGHLGEVWSKNNI